MRPLDFVEFTDMSILRQFNEYHQTEFCDWYTFWETIGYKFYMNSKEEYSLYLNWMAIRDTPLYMVMKEVESDEK